MCILEPGRRIPGRGAGAGGPGMLECRGRWGRFGARLRGRRGVAVVLVHVFLLASLAQAFVLPSLSCLCYPFIISLVLWNGWTQVDTTPGEPTHWRTQVGFALRAAVILPLQHVRVQRQRILLRSQIC